MKCVSRQTFCLFMTVSMGLASRYAIAQAPPAAERGTYRERSRAVSSSTNPTSQTSVARSSSSDAPISETPKPMLAITVWALTLVEPTGRAEAESKVKSSEDVDNPPPEFQSSKEVRDFIQELKRAKRVRSSRELRIVTLDGQTARVEVGTDSPQITASNVSNRGRQNAIMYRPLGTIVDVRPRIDSEKYIQIQLEYNLNDMAKSNDVAIVEEPDGKSQFADVMLKRQLKTTVRLPNGGAVVAHCDASTGWADKSGDGQTELIIVGATIAKAN